MKTRTRVKSPGLSATDKNRSPRFTRVIIGTFLFVIFWWIIANYSIEHYIFLLLFVMPIMYIWDLLLNYIYKKFWFLQIYTYSFLILFFILYIFTSLNFFLYVWLIYFLIQSFVKYVFFLHRTSLLRQELREKERKAKESFDTFVGSKNFLNHHNYFNSPREVLAYKKSKKRNLFRDASKASKVLWLLFLGAMLQQLITWEIDIVMMLLIIWAISWIAWILFACISLWKYTIQFKYKKFKIYQAKISTSDYIERKNKIFFY